MGGWASWGVVVVEVMGLMGRGMKSDLISFLLLATKQFPLEPLFI